MIILQMWYTNT